MKKIFTFIVVLLCLASCAKDGITKEIYKGSTTIENTTYRLEVAQVDGSFAWFITNGTAEVTYNYAFHYDNKNALRQDFADVVSGLESVDNSFIGSLFPVFSVNFRFTDEFENEAVISRYVDGGYVFVSFTLGPRHFSLPYKMVIEANKVLNPEV